MFLRITCLIIYMFHSSVCIVYGYCKYCMLITSKSRWVRILIECRKNDRCSKKKKILRSCKHHSWLIDTHFAMSVAVISTFPWGAECVYMSLFTGVCVSDHWCVCLCSQVYMSVFTGVYVSVYRCICLCSQVCMSLFTCAYVYVHRCRCMSLFTGADVCLCS